MSRDPLVQIFFGLWPVWLIAGLMLLVAKYLGFFQ